jgi:hypothetical protein
VLAGCAGGGVGTFRPFFYRMTHAVGDVPSVDLFVDKTISDASVAYGASTSFTETTTENGFATYDLKVAGTSDYVDSLSLDKGSDQSVHLFALGMHTPGSLQPQARLFPITINRVQPAGNARIYLIHGYMKAAGSQPPPIDFMRIGQIQPQATNLDFGNFTTFTLPPNTYTFEVRFASTSPPGTGGILFPTTTPVVVQAGKIYVFLIRGVEGGAGPLAPTLDIFEEPVRIP